MAAAYSVSRVVKIPMMWVSGLSVVTAPMAITAGLQECCNKETKTPKLRTNFGVFGVFGFYCLKICLATALSKGVFGCCYLEGVFRCCLFVIIYKSQIRKVRDSSDDDSVVESSNDDSNSYH
ncbi:Aldolase-type TIM barrel [Artemisia annua]|uniref:Aldolase-type TIM barrel n=1 Tax=Artemisia annua TaxID=35608 RepID=A0A2U1NC07_ARTAN|nr:Aldolase-type TIM barrel [Artemisia annua]